MLHQCRLLLSLITDDSVETALLVAPASADACYERLCRLLSSLITHHSSLKSACLTIDEAMKSTCITYHVSRFTLRQSQNLKSACHRIQEWLYQHSIIDGHFCNEASFHRFLRSNFYFAFFIEKC